MKTGKEVFIMKKTYKIDVDCANCANKMEQAAKNTDGVKDATVNFMRGWRSRSFLLNRLGFNSLT